jgi:diaminohydroxyphosphoribosylaminopyrimidine deaminase / 5-amino-6-(5-phosphoribosylamino)uracil reductase
MQFPDEQAVMQRAVELAVRGIGLVEPNPPVGAVVVDEALALLGEGWHARYGGPHAEVAALEAAGESARGATLFVTLEPCAHHGKTPPCADAVLAAGVRRVVICVPDPAPHTSGRGIERLRERGIDVEIGMCAEQGRELIAPFTKLMTTGIPYVHAKWAMTLDGKIATRTGNSQWISNDSSRARVHELRSRMDGILVGIGTVLADDPLLTARPQGKEPRRIPARIILDRRGELPLHSRLVQTVDEAPVMAVTGPEAAADRCTALNEAGVEVLTVSALSAAAMPSGEEDAGQDSDGPSRDDAAPVALLEELGRRRLTNLLVEGGSRVLGAFRDGGLIDEVHCFIAPKIVGGRSALSPIGGHGRTEVPSLPSLRHPQIELLDGDVYIHGRITS